MPPRAKAQEDSSAGTEAGEAEESAEAYPDEIPVEPDEGPEQFAESSDDNWGIPEALRLYRISEELYAEGRYQEAVAILLRVIELDPNAPELYYNIALVFEHLQEFDRALEFLEQYNTFDIGAEEQRRVERMMNRIRGAREHLPPTVEVQTRTRVVVQRFGRADGIFWGMVGSTILFAAGAAVTGGLAIDWSNASEDFTVGVDGDLADYRYWINVADTLALMTDILIGVAAASAITALLLYVLRTHPAIEVREEIGDGPISTEGGEIHVDDAQDDGDAESGDGDEADDAAESGATGPAPSLVGRHRRLPVVGVGVGAVMIGWEF